MRLSSLPRSVVARARSRAPGAAVAPRLWRGARYRLVLRRLAGPKLVRAFADAYPEAFFVEIGSSDGERDDHLRAMILSRRWRGIMVEPVPYVFERLRDNYGGLGRVALENVAIAERDGRRPFYFLAQAEEGEPVPPWYDEIGSFSRDVVLSHRRRIPDIERRIVRAEVPCVTFETLCRKHDVEHVDLLLLDTEGYDYEILKGIDFVRHRPRLVAYEHYHLSPRQRSECRTYLEGLGYETMEEGFDTWCLDAQIDDRLSRRWRRLRPAVAGVYAHDETP